MEEKLIMNLEIDNMKVILEVFDSKIRKVLNELMDKLFINLNR